MTAKPTSHKIRCQINYQHTLRELSVNRKDPCEVIRELISNSYDAKASKIEIYPLLQYSGFIFFDNGTGISDSQEINGATPLDAFFSIGVSTKTPGQSIGYKCQGSKLCFASGKFSLITRCGYEKESNWRTVIIDNPRETLNTDKDNIEAVEDSTPWLTLRDLLPQPDSRTIAILKQLDQSFFDVDFQSGTLIIIKDLEIEDFSYYYATDREYPYIKSYIQFYTRHGDVRILAPEKGFSSVDQKNFKSSSTTYNDKCQLFLWNCSSDRSNLEKIPPGYPYVDKPDFFPGYEKYIWKLPAEIRRLNLGRFFYRQAKTFKFDGNTYCITFAIDGNRRALEYYDELDRQGKKKSGMSFSSQRGTFICAEGVKICEYNEIFSNSLLSDYLVLSDSKCKTHYVLMINGSFQLVTNRNSLSEASVRILQNDQFLEKIKDFLDKAYNNSEVFSQLIQRIGNKISDGKIEAQVKRFDQSKSEIPRRDYFYIQNIEQLKNKKMLVPIQGEEHGVGALYTLLSYFVPIGSPYYDLWLRPLNFSGQGIDSIATQLSDDKIQKELKGLEYKYLLSTDELFNHPLVITDQIVCWEIDLQDSDPVDDGEYVGQVYLTDELKDGLGCEISNIQNRYGNCHDSNVKVICLKQLIDKTFSCDWKQGFDSLQNYKKTRKRRRK